jgi:hypothetical protein
VRLGTGLRFYFVPGATVVSVDPVVHYRFARTATLDAYGLAGPALSFVRLDLDGQSLAYLNVGVNVGAGLEVPVGDRLRPFGEARLVVDTRSLLSLTGGMRAVF